jgi:hypothetical protein
MRTKLAQWQFDIDEQNLSSLARCLFHMSAETPEISSVLAQMPPLELHTTFSNIKDIRFIVWAENIVMTQFVQKLHLEHLFLFSIDQKSMRAPTSVLLPHKMVMTPMTSIKNVGYFADLNDIFAQFFYIKVPVEIHRLMRTLPYFLCIFPFGDDHFNDVKIRPNGFPQIIDLSDRVHKSMQHQQITKYELFTVLNYTNRKFSIDVKNYHSGKWHVYNDEKDNKTEVSDILNPADMQIMFIYRSLDPLLRSRYIPREEFAHSLHRTLQVNKLSDISLVMSGLDS